MSRRVPYPEFDGVSRQPPQPNSSDDNVLSFVELLWRYKKLQIIDEVMLRSSDENETSVLSMVGLWRTMDGSTSAKREIEANNIDEQNKACITKVGPWGGKTGESHEINVELEPACLHSITIRSGETIHAIAFSFSDKDGNPHHAGPWGAKEHPPTGVFDTILLGPTEHLIKISGTVDGIPFNSQEMGVGSIVGFFVRAMAMVNAIGTYVNSTRQPTEKRGLITKIGPWGRNGGILFDVDVLPRRLVSMVIRSGQLIDSIAFTYSDCDGKLHSAGPWGGHGIDAPRGKTIHTIVLGPSEFLMEISGTIGPSPHPYLVNSLLLITNTGSYGPFGAGQGIPFCSPELTNSSIVGFFVRSGWYIDAIGVYVHAIEEKDNGRASSTIPNREDPTKVLNKPCITKIGLWGGEKGSLRDIHVAPICLNNITICSGEVVHSFAFSYSDDRGKQHHAGPWGISEGSFDMVSCWKSLVEVEFKYERAPNTGAEGIQLGPSEFLTQVSGTLGSFSRNTQDVAVTSVTFTTNARQYGPFGRVGRVPFHSPGMSNGSITGFFARSGEGAIDAIGIYVNRAEPMEKRGLITKIGPWGMAGSYDLDVLPRRLISVVVCCGQVIDSLAFTYIGCDGQQHSVGPWGSMNASQLGSFHTIMLGRSDFLKEISGTIKLDPHSSDVVTSLLLVTNTGSHGPFGEGGGTPFCSPVHDNFSIVGFFAGAGKNINALGAYLKTRNDQVLRRWRYRWNKSVNYPPLGYEQVNLCIDIALKCLSDSPRERPDISEIVNMLNTVESANEQINYAGDSTVGTISLYPWELVQPDTLDLNFAFEINKQIPCSFQVTNVTDDCVAFSIKVEGELLYRIEPERSVVSPRSKCNVNVTLQAQKRAPHATEDFFIMRCAPVNECATAVDITEDIFAEKSGKVDEVTLKVIIEPVAIA